MRLDSLPGPKSVLAALPSTKLLATSLLCAALGAQLQTPLHTNTGGANSTHGWAVSKFGFVSGLGPVYLVGEPGFNAVAGRVLVVDKFGTVVSSVAATTAGDRFGIGITSMGLWSTDGQPDFAVGAIQGNVGTTRPNGYVQLYRGGVNQTLAVTISAGTVPSNHNVIEFGLSLASGGDIDGDGVVDLVVGAPNGGATTSSGTGRVYVYSGAALRNATGTISHTNSSYLLGVLDNIADGTGNANRFGQDVCLLADVNGDGRPEVCVGTPLYDAWNGKVYVYSWNPATSSLQLIYTRTGPAGSQFGWALCDAGDTNGDGKHDLVAGAPHAASQAHGNVGSATVLSGKFIGGQGGPDALQVTYGDANHGGPKAPNVLQYGTDVASVGDLDGDGKGDFVVGANNAHAYGPDFDPSINNWPTDIVNGGSQAGMVRIVAGADGACLKEFFGPLVQLSSFGWTVAGVDDLDNDGKADIVVGAPQGSVGGTGPGFSQAFSGAYTLGRTYGTGTLNTAGLTAKIGARGSLGFAAGRLVATCRDLPPNQFGIFFYGFAPKTNGPIWIAGSLYRLDHAGQVLNSGPLGEVSLSIDPATLPPAVPPMTRVYFEYWSRDVGGTVCYSNAIDLGIQP
ncbi:MAG: integrin alpha [Planctomycetota bacterium]